MNLVEGMNSKKRMVFLILLITLIEISSAPVVFSVENAKLSLTPEHSYRWVGESFIVNVTVTNVTDLYNWQIDLAFNPFIVNCVEVTIPEDNVFAGYDTTAGVEINNTSGSLRSFNGLWELKGVNGSGKLCQIKFNTLRPGISILAFTNKMDVYGTYLQNSELNNITFEASDGIIEVTGENFQSYVFNVTLSDVRYDITIFTNSTITNFNLSQSSQKISFMATGVSNSTVSCSVSVPKVLLNSTFAILVNETTAYYTMSEGDIYYYLHFTHSLSTKNIQILTTIIGDINGDRKIDMKDVAMAAKAFGTTPDHQRWDPRADLNKDININMKDIAIIVKNFGKFWQTSA